MVTFSAKNSTRPRIQVLLISEHPSDAMRWHDVSTPCAAGECIELGSSRDSTEDTDDGGGRAQEELDEVDKTEEAGQAAGDTSDVGGQGDESILCYKIISVISF